MTVEHFCCCILVVSCDDRFYRRETAVQQNHSESRVTLKRRTDRLLGTGSESNSAPFACQTSQRRPAQICFAAGHGLPPCPFALWCLISAYKFSRCCCTFRALFVPVNQIRTEQIEFVIQSDELTHQLVLHLAVHRFIVLSYPSRGLKSIWIEAAQHHMSFDRL